MKHMAQSTRSVLPSRSLLLPSLLSLRAEGPLWRRAAAPLLLLCLFASAQALAGATGTNTPASSNPSVGLGGAPAPAYVLQVGGKGPDNNLHALSTDNSGNLNTNRTWSLSSGSDSVSAVQSGAWSVTANAGTNLNTSLLALENGGHLASADTKLSTINTTLGSPFQAGGSIGNTSFGISGTLPAYAATPTFNLGTLNGAALAANQTNGTQQTQVVQGGNTLAIGASGNIVVSGLSAVGSAPSLNPVSVAGIDGGGLKRHFLTDAGGRLELDTAQSLPLPAGASTEATLSSLNAKVTAVNTGAVVVSSSALPAGAATSALQTTGNSSLSSIDGKLTTTANGLKVDGSAVTQPVSVAAAVQTKAPLNVTGSGTTGTVSTVITLTAPANAVGFVLQNLDTSTANMRWAIGRTATTSVGSQLQPGRDTGFVPFGGNVSLVAESGTQNYDIAWVSQ